jgi:hypothetical protein
MLSLKSVTNSCGDSLNYLPKNAYETQIKNHQKTLLFAKNLPKKYFAAGGVCMRSALCPHVVNRNI